MKKWSTRLALGLGLAALTAAAGLAQMAISAKAGMVNYVEGDVYLADQLVAIKFGQFPQLKPEQVLRATDEGRAEMILSPGVFLRVAEGGSVKMLSDKLEDVRLEVLSGSVLVEAVDLPQDNKVSFVYKGSEVLISKPGLYRIDSAQDRLRVYSGEALVRTVKGPVLVKGARELVLAGEFAAAKFDKDETDSFFRWAARRSEGISVANVSSARMASRSACSSCLNTWYYNPYYGMFSYLPGRNFIRSPFGYYFFGMNGAMDLYMPYYYYGPPRPGGAPPSSGGGAYMNATRSMSDFGGGRMGGGGYNGGGGGGGGSYGYTPSMSSGSVSGGGMSAGGGAAASAGGGGGTRSSSDGAGRGGSGGGRGQ